MSPIVVLLVTLLALFGPGVFCARPYTGYATKSVDSANARVQMQSSSSEARLRKAKIGIVGGGLAGLTAAYRLQGYPMVDYELFEGSERWGGRAFTAQFPNGQTYERGGELIDSWHEDIRDLCRELGLQLVDVKTEEPFPEVYKVWDYSVHPPRQVFYGEEEATQDMLFKKDPVTKDTVLKRVRQDARAIYPTNYADAHDQPWELTYKDPVYAAYLDSLTLTSYINLITSHLKVNSSDPDGRYSKLAQLLRVAYTGEFSADTSQQSAINLIFLLGYGKRSEFELFGISDERYYIKGGVGRLVRRLLQRIPNPARRLHHRLTSVERQSNGQYLLRFNVSNDTKTFGPYDRVVLALPFATIRADPRFPGVSVDMTLSGISSLKAYAIQQLPMGVASKMMVQFDRRYWRVFNEANGASYCSSDPYIRGQVESCYQNTWEHTRAQDGVSGILVNFQSDAYSRIRSTTSDNLLNSTAYLINETEYFLTLLDQVIPGARANFTYEFDEHGRIVNVQTVQWSESPWQRGAYSFWRNGSYIGCDVLPGSTCHSFAGFEGQAEPFNLPVDERNLHFAGEHTQFDNQGYLDGAVVSGNRVVLEMEWANVLQGVV
jgi:monoamine oxidase